MIKVGKYEFESGDAVMCTIRGRQILNAKIYYLENYGENRCWVCHDDENAEGDISPDLLGYKFSWVLNPASNLDRDVTNLVPMPQFLGKKKFIVSPDILHYLYENNLSALYPIFEYKLGIFDEYNEYLTSENEGFILLKNESKSVEIKMGRFVRQMCTKLNEFEYKDDDNKYPQLNITDKVIEDIHNKYVSFQKRGFLEVSILSGKEILEGYKVSSYPSDDTRRSGTLFKSCMNDRLDFLSIYSENPSQVKLAVIKINGFVVSRSLIWKTVDNEEFFDRIYYQHDWMQNVMSDKLKFLGYKDIKKSTFKMVQLENWKFPKYPYADSFFYFDRDNGTLLSMGEKISQLRNTNGQL